MQPFDSRGIFDICLYAFNQIPEAYGRIEQKHNLFHLKAGSNWLIRSTGKIPVNRSLVDDIITIPEMSYRMDKRKTRSWTKVGQSDTENETHSGPGKCYSLLFF